MMIYSVWEHKMSNSTVADATLRIMEIMNLNPKSNPASEMLKSTMKDVLSVKKDELDFLVQFVLLNRNNQLLNFKSGANGLNRFLDVVEMYESEKKSKKKKMLLEKSESKLESLITRVLNLKKIMGDQIDQVESKKYSSKVINPDSPIFTKKYIYDHLIGALKNYAGDNKIVFTSLSEKSMIVKMTEFKMYSFCKPNTKQVTHKKKYSNWGTNLLDVYIRAYCNNFISSYFRKIESNNSKILNKEMYENKNKELMVLISDLNYSKNYLPNSMEKIYPQVKQALSVNYEATLNFSGFKFPNGERYFTDKEASTLNKIGFRRIYGMRRDDLVKEFSKIILNRKEFIQVENKDKVQALIGRAAKGVA